jgi:myo-inositol 2-dehydrogenase/D-chiro-inositol 1-dehydrogenase
LKERDMKAAARKKKGASVLRFAQFGAGRIGCIHAGNLAATEGAQLRYVVDLNAAAAAALARRHGAGTTSVAAALADPDVDAVLIASSTDTHADLAIAAARAGKAIFCEKPIDLTLSRVDACLSAVRKARVPFFTAFNRRFDPSFASLRERMRKGDIGKTEQVIITSRDPGLPPIAYLKTSGGLFRDMTIHDLDMARWLLGEEPVEVFAWGACLVDPAVEKAGDIDTAMLMLRTASGRQCQINNTRRAVYGYDQRIEVLGSKGRLIANNWTPTTVEMANEAAVSVDKPQPFFLERYAAAYKAELTAFVDAVRKGTPMPVSETDGRQALVMANAANKSLQSGRPVKIGAPK